VSTAPSSPDFFQGQHCPDVPPDVDRRRVTPNTFWIDAEADLQVKIDTLPSDLQSLFITTSQYLEGNGAVLDRPLPDLLELTILDAPMSKIILTEKSSPKLRSLTLRTV